MDKSSKGSKCNNKPPNRGQFSRGWGGRFRRGKGGNCPNSPCENLEKSLKNVRCGETVTVSRLGGRGPLRRRIMDMGITKGTDIYVRKVAPLGDPIQIVVRDYELTIRKNDACQIIVE